MKKYYLIVNPAGGTKKGLKILEIVRPIFDKSGVHIDILQTEKLKSSTANTGRVFNPF